jgi:TonB-dependent SusC/RagA subfamily outer membrane receptor
MKALITLLAVLFCSACFGQVEKSTALIKINNIQKATDSSVRIRFHCAATHTNDQKPLMVIDGIVKEFAMLETVNPNEIESVTILKGESATKIYGSKAKDGVILITMKCKKEKIPAL